MRNPSSLMKKPEPSPLGVRTWTTASPICFTSSSTLCAGSGLSGAE